METRILSDLAVHGSFIMAENRNDFPENPRIGTMVVKDQVLYGYISIGGLDTWYPFASKTNSYIHSQAVPALEWIVSHNLGTMNTWAQVKDSQGSIVQVSIQNIDDSTIKVKFTTATAGTVIVVAPDTIDVPIVKSSLIEAGDGYVIIDNSGIRIGGEFVLTAGNIEFYAEQAVQAETAARIAADQSLESAIAAEAAARIAADSAIDSKIDTEIASALVDVIPTSAKGVANGVATLDNNGLVPSAQLPSYVDDVLEYATIAEFPAVGEAGKIYVETSTSKSYRWTGSTYVYITSGAVDSVNGKTGVVTLTAADISGLATVATSGSYNDLTDKPTFSATKLERTTTFDATALGKRVVITAGVTIPASVYTAGDAFSFYNNSGTAITIAQGAGLTLRQDGTTTIGNRQLAPYGTCFVWYDSATVAVIGGSLT